MRRSRIIAAAVLAVTVAAGAGGYALAAGTLTGVTVAGCLAGGKLTSVQVTRVPGCAASATPVQWPGQARLASPSPSPSPSPSGTATPQCVTSQPDGNPCQLAAVSFISGSNGFNTYGGNNCWADPSCAATSTFYDPGRWDTSITEPAGNTSVRAYPDVQQLYSEQPLSSLTSISSTYTETMNATSGTIAWAAYDVWLNNWGAEVLIAVDNHGIDPSYEPVMGHFTAGGVSYTAYDNGSERVVVADTSSQSGTVDVLAVLTWLQNNGHLPASSTLTAVDFGWEVCSTAGSAEDFAVTGYGLAVV